MSQSVTLLLVTFCHTDGVLWRTAALSGPPEADHADPHEESLKFRSDSLCIIRSPSIERMYL